MSIFYRFFASEFFAKFALLLSLVIISRKFSVSEFGVVSFMQILFFYAMMITDQGINQIMIRELGKGVVFKKKTFRVILNRKLTVATILAAIVILYAYYFDEANQWVYIYYILAILLYVFNFNWYFVGIGKALQASIINIIQTVSFLMLIVVVYYVMSLDKLEYFSLCYLVSMALMAVCYGTAFYRRYRTFESHSADHLDVVRKDSKRNFISLVFVQIYVSSNMFLLYWITDSTQVGFYNAAYRIVNVITSVVSVSIVYFLPIYSKYFHSKDEKDRNLINRFMNITFCFSLLILIGGSVNSREVMMFVFGEDYADASPIFMILTVSSFFVIWNVILGAILQAKGYQDYIMKITGMVAVLNILLSLPFIFISGGNGAAFAGLISELFIFIAYGLSTYKFLKFNFNRPTLSHVLAFVLLVAGQFFFKVFEIHVLLTVAFYGLVFFWLFKLKSELLLLGEKESSYG